MNSNNSKPSFLTKFLRPDKKDKPKTANENNKRFSAPVHGWSDNFHFNMTTDELKLQEQKRKKQVKYSSQQNLSEIKKQKTTKTKPVANKEKKQSSSRSSWFCMSGNADTLDRSSLPAQPKNNKNASKSNIKKDSNNEAQMPTDILRQNGGKKIRHNKNRHSAPVSDWSTVRAPVKEETPEVHTTTENASNSKLRRDSSPGVRYRFDGTLEKPYVFPAGLTFGPEGRRLQLRRSSNTPVVEKHRNSKENLVKVEVHRSSTEDIIMEYSYEESEPDLSQFDVRKAFYLKYDSNLAHSTDHLNNFKSDVGNTSLPKGAAVNSQQQENRWKPKETTGIATQRNSRRQLRAERSKNRYNMPDKNENIIYMGSCENVNISDNIEQEGRMSKSSFDISGKNKSARNGSDKRDRRNRYSMPIRNTDFVYMGSFENINQLLNLDTSSGFTLPNEDGKVYDVDEEDNGSLEASLILESNNKKANKKELKKFEEANEPQKDTLMQHECNRQSLPNLALITGLSVPNNNSEEHNDSQHEDEEYDLFDDSFLSAGRTRSSTHENPFSRRAGRSSCNPGNKRSFIPPPAMILPSLSPTSTVPSLGANLKLSSFMPGNKPFTIPPPPSYTPPKDDTDFSQVHMKDTTCHRGSQTDLSVEFESLNMEDRDSSLQLAEVRTIFAAVCARNGKVHFEDPADPPNNMTKDYHPLAQSSKTGITSLNPKSTKTILDVSDSSQCSDDVFDDTHSTFFAKNEFATSKLTKLPTTNSRLDWERNHAIKSSPVVFLPTKTDDITKDASLKAKHLNFSNITGPTLSYDSLHFTTSTPKEKQRIQQDCVNDSKPQLPQNRPAPLPRNIYNPPGLNNKSDQSVYLPQNDIQQPKTNNSVPPVPKKRHSLTYSRSLSSAGDFEKKFEPAQTSLVCERKKLNNGKLARTQSYDPSSTLQRRQNIERANMYSGNTTENKYEDTNDDHFYEDIDSGNQENIYEVCGEISLENYSKDRSLSKRLENGKVQIINLENWLTPLHTIKLEKSPGQHRRNRPRGSLTGELLSAHSGLAYSLDELADVLAEKRCHFYDNDDNSSIADDEMSLSNEEDTDERLKQHSLRRCVSADNLLRSGSILDRSMILAKRRRKQMRERRSKSHLFTDRKDFMDFNAFANLNTSYDVNTNASKVRYNKRKTTSNERLYKHKASHNDSGHDSEIVSPCTSPDARRHHGNTTAMSYQRPFDDLDDPCAPRQGTLPKKPWEIRLRNTQYQRKSRSRENLLTLAPKI